MQPQGETTPEEEIPIQRCTGCGKDYQKTAQFFYVRPKKDGSLYIRKVCKTCHSKQTNQEKKHPKGTPNQCGACGLKTGNIIGDIDEATQKRHGYLCAKCYRLVRDFHKDAKRLSSVFKYIQRTRRSQKAKDTKDAKN